MYVEEAMPVIHITVKATTNLTYARKGYFQFDLSTLADPSSLSGASFNFNLLNGRDVNNWDSDFTLNMYGLVSDTSWDETSLTWDTAPANLDTSDGIDTDDTQSSYAVSLGTMTLQNSGVYSFSDQSLLDYIQAEVGSDDNFATLILTGDINLSGSDQVKIQADTATLGTTAVPEPASVALLGLAGILFLRRKR